MRITATFRYRGDIQTETERGLTADRFMRTVVEKDVPVILGRKIADIADSTHVHDKGTVTVKTVDTAVRLLKGNPQGNGRTVTHGTHS